MSKKPGEPSPPAPEPRAAESPPRRRALWLAVLLPLALYLFFAGRFIGAGLGYEMDEALYVQSAVFLLEGGLTPPSSRAGRTRSTSAAGGGL